MDKRQPSSLKEAWALCFILGVVMLNYPFLHIVNKDFTIFGIPVLYLYFLLGWPVSILIIYLFTRSLDTFAPPDNSDDGEDRGE